MSVCLPHFSAGSRARCYGVILQRRGSAISTVLGLLQEMKTLVRRRPLTAANANQPSASHSFGLLAEISEESLPLSHNASSSGEMSSTLSNFPLKPRGTDMPLFFLKDVPRQSSRSLEQRALVTRTDAGGPSTRGSGSRPGIAGPAVWAEPGLLEPVSL